MSFDSIDSNVRIRKRILNLMAEKVYLLISLNRFLCSSSVSSVTSLHATCHSNVAWNVFIANRYIGEQCSVNMQSVSTVILVQEAQQVSAVLSL